MDIDLLRTLLSDNDIDNPLLTDDQYDYLASLEGNVYNAAAAAARAIAAKYATKKKVNVRGISVENQQIYDHYMGLAKDYDYRAQQGAGYIDSSGKGISNFSTPIVTGVTVAEALAALRDANRVQNVFPKPESDVL
ncbi:MAG: hypothetical protein NC124_02355 [Clostridium sp.]|nr:hypothetical protein [Clostridium sp.]